MKKQITLSLITIVILGLNGCGGGSAKNSTSQSEALNLIRENSSVELEKQDIFEDAVKTALEKNTNILKVHGLLGEDAKQESRKFIAEVLKKLNLDTLETSIIEECGEDDKCKEEAYTSLIEVLTKNKELPYATNMISLILDKEEAYAIAQAVRENDKEKIYSIPINDILVKKFTCEAGEVKTVQHYGLEDNFSTANGVEQNYPSNQVVNIPSIANYNDGIGISPYDTTQINRQFAEEIKNLPTGITKGMFYIGLENHGSNDKITIGNIDGNSSTLDFFKGDIVGLDSSFGWNKSGHVYFQSFANIDFQDNTSLKDYVQTNNSFDVYVQDDTYVDFITVATCSKPNPILEIEAIVNNFECNEREGDLLQISGGVIDAFAPGDDSTTPSATLANSVSPSPVMDYDNPAYNKHFIDTLNLGLTTSQIVTKAEFHIGYKSTNYSIWTNDMLYLGEYGINHAGFKLYSNSTNNFIGNTWNINIVNGETIASTDLNLNNTVGIGTVFGTMVNNGFLDVHVQDDTSVDFTQLNLCVKDNCDENAKKIKLDLSQLSSWIISATDASHNNPIPTVWDNSLNWIEFASQEPNSNRVLKIPFCACGNTVVKINSLKADNNATIYLDNNLIVTQNAPGQASMLANSNGGVNASGSFVQLAGNGYQDHTLKLEVNNQYLYFGVAIDGSLSFKGYLGKCKK